jgi:hypothetical protein
MPALLSGLKNLGSMIMGRSASQPRRPWDERYDPADYDTDPATIDYEDSSDGGYTPPMSSQEIQAGRPEANPYARPQQVAIGDMDRDVARESYTPSQDPTRPTRPPRQYDMSGPAGRNFERMESTADQIETAPRAPGWRKFLGELSTITPAGMFADEITYGWKGAEDRNRAAQSYRMRGDLTKYGMGIEQNERMREDSEIRREQNRILNQSRQDALNEKRYATAIDDRRTGEADMAKVGGRPLNDPISIEPSSSYSTPSLPPRGMETVSDPDAAVQTTLPTRVLNPGMSATSDQLVPKGWSKRQLPPRPKFGEDGGVVRESAPEDSYMAPPPGVLAQETAEAKNRAKLDTYEELPEPVANALSIPKGTKIPPDQLRFYAAMYEKHLDQSGDHDEAKISARRAVAQKLFPGMSARDLEVYALTGKIERPPTVNVSNQLANDTTAIESLVESMEENPDTYFNIKDKKLKNEVEKRWAQKTGLPLPAKLHAAAQDQEAKARITIGHLDNARRLLKDPVVLKRLGAVRGRVGNLEQALGDTAGLTPEESQKIQNLRSSLTYLTLREAQAILGGRPAVTMVEWMKKTSPRIDESLPMLLGAIDAGQQSAELALEGIDAQRFGGKSRKSRKNSTLGGTGVGGGVPKVGETFNGEKVKKVTRTQ